jgi:hypothetical protein
MSPAAACRLKLLEQQWALEKLAEVAYADGNSCHAARWFAVAQAVKAAADEVHRLINGGAP